jgi:hypothetical protein
MMSALYIKKVKLVELSHWGIFRGKNEVYPKNSNDMDSCFITNLWFCVFKFRSERREELNYLFK